MSRRDCDMPLSRASFAATGIINITNGVLFINADIAAAATSKAKKVKDGDCFACFTAMSAARSTAPVRTKAADIINMAAIVAIAVDDNIDRTLSIVSMPVTSNAATPSPAVTSGERHSRAKPTKSKMINIAVSGAPIWVRSIKPETPYNHQCGGFWVGAPAVVSASKSSMRPLSVSIRRLNSAITLA